MKHTRYISSYAGPLSTLSLRATLLRQPTERYIKRQVRYMTTPSQSTPRIFVSHSHADNEFCRIFVDALRAGGCDVWYDEYNLGWGALRQVIEREMQACQHFVAILSPAAVTSEWVNAEIDAGLLLLGQSKLQSLMFVTAAACDVPLLLQRYKRIERPDGAGYDPAEAAERVINVLSPHPATTAPTNILPAQGHSSPGTSGGVADLIERGKAFIAKNQFAAAVPFFVVATQLVPENADAWADLAWAYSESQRPGEALAAAEHALALNPRSARAWNGRGNAFLSLGRYSEALAALDQALSLRPQFAHAWNNRGNVFLSLRRYEEALTAYDTALSIDPALAWAWSGKGIVFTHMKHYTAALAAHDRARSLAPEDPSVWRSRAFSLRTLKKPKEAEEAERRASELEINAHAAL